MQKIQTHLQEVSKLFALFWLLSVQWVFAADFHCPEHPIRVAFDDRGFNYFKGKGFDLDLAKELEKRSGCTMRFSEMPRARIFVALEKGEQDMAFFAIQTPERDRYAWFAPYMVQKNYVHLAPGVAESAKTLSVFEANPKLSFGVVSGLTHGANYEVFLQRLRAQNRVVDVPTTEQLFRMLAAGRVHAAMSLPTVSSFYAKELVPEIAKLPGLDWDSASAAPAHQLMMSKQTFSESDARAWQSLMARTEKDGTVRKFIGNYVVGRDLQRSLLP